MRTFCPHLGSFCVVSSFTTFRPHFTSGLLHLFKKPHFKMIPMKRQKKVLYVGRRRRIKPKIMLFSQFSRENWNILSSSSSSSCRTDSTYLPDPLSPPVPIVHCSREVFKPTSFIGTDLLYVDFSWPSCFCSSMWRGPQEYVTYEFAPTSPSVSCMWWVVSGRTAAVLCSAVSRTYLILFTEFLWNCSQPFSPYV